MTSVEGLVRLEVLFETQEPLCIISCQCSFRLHLLLLLFSSLQSTRGPCSVRRIASLGGSRECFGARDLQSEANDVTPLQPWTFDPAFGRPGSTLNLLHLMTCVQSGLSG